jgi:hypothetical protein
VVEVNPARAGAADVSFAEGRVSVDLIENKELKYVAENLSGIPAPSGGKLW